MEGNGTVFLSWNIANWITVLLMVALGYLAISAIVASLKGGTSGAFDAVRGLLPSFGGGGA